MYLVKALKDFFRQVVHTEYDQHYCYNRHKNIIIHKVPNQRLRLKNNKTAIKMLFNSRQKKAGEIRNAF